MGWPQFLTWALAQGFKHTKFLRQAYRHFASTGKIPGKEVILKTARNLYDKFIAKVPTKKIADKVRKDLKKDKPKRFEWEPQENFDARLRAILEKHKAKLPKKTAEIIKFPKPFKKPPHLKAGGGRIDKALPGRSRDI